MQNNTMTVHEDINVRIPRGMSSLVLGFQSALERIDTLYKLQSESPLSAFEERKIWVEIPKLLLESTSDLSHGQEAIFHNRVLGMKKGIFDLYPITVYSPDKSLMEFVIGKVFLSDSQKQGSYSGAAGIITRRYDETIRIYDSNLERIANTLLVTGDVKVEPVGEKVPDIRCMEVFSLKGGLNLSHKPICVFYSGGEKENLSALSHMTVFINLYVARYKAVTERIAHKYMEDYSLVECLTDDEIAKILLIWLRGHDVGHFTGPDNLSSGMSEFDMDYMILHELKADMTALYSMRCLSEELLAGDGLRKAYTLSIAEMFRYIRRGGFYTHPDTGSALLAFFYFLESGAISLDRNSGKFVIDFDRLELVVEDITKELLKIFTDGNVKKAKEFTAQWGDTASMESGGLTPELRAVYQDNLIPRLIEYNFITTENE